MRENEDLQPAEWILAIWESNSQMATHSPVRIGVQRVQKGPVGVQMLCSLRGQLPKNTQANQVLRRRV